ncbi:MAG: TRAFs-binding domain-containing protein, partial [Pseudomonadota bacterium]
NTGKPEEAIASLEQLNERLGETPERLGIIGGRYKRLWRATQEQREEEGGERPNRLERRYLGKAIDHYTRGMQLDFNEFYCSSNIAQLLLVRAEEGDAERAVVVDHFVIAACERAIARGTDDEWTRPTLLGAAFRSRDVRKARELAAQIDREDPANWKLQSTIGDLRQAVAQASGTTEADAFAQILAGLEELIE